MNQNRKDMDCSTVKVSWFSAAHTKRAKPNGNVDMRIVKKKFIMPTSNVKCDGEREGGEMMSGIDHKPTKLLV